MGGIEEKDAARKEDTIELLLEVADGCERLRGRRGGACLAKLRPELTRLMEAPSLKEYGLDEKDALVIAVLFGLFFETEEELTAMEVLRMFEKDKKAVFLGVKRLKRLKEAEIIRESERPERGVMMLDDEAPPDDGDGTAGFDLLRSSICLTDGFLNMVLKGDTGTEVKPYADYMEYLLDQFSRVDKAEEDFVIAPWRRRRRRFGARGRLGNRAQGEIERRIAERLAVTKKIFPLEEFKKRKELDRKEELIIIALLKAEMDCGEGCEKDELLNIISRTPYESYLDRKLFEKNGRLVRQGIIEVVSRHGIMNEDSEESVRLNDDVKRRLLEEKKSRMKMEIKGGGLFEIVKPTVALDSVVLHPKTLEDVITALEMIKSGAAAILRKWGVKGVNLTQTELGKNRHQPLTMLFHGAPGTGKTLTANAVAFALKRELITFDCSKILSCWVGTSEKNTRRIFDRYRELSKGMKNPPVLLLNEADQFLHRRLNAERSVDNMYNQMQNIFLEQMEKFEGVLIATTNLKEGMDSAFSRRFHCKVEFRRPGPEERLKLWQIHMPEKAPLAEDVDLNYLARNYDLSGGQIAVIVRNAAAKAARRGDRLYLSDLIMACDDERAGNFDGKAWAKAGF
ncbi:MAG: ATP-binding protein [Deltaproteobacteria bacterium]|nr:ATP-binding protein [Deltaproteobacteria bacterium]